MAEYMIEVSHEGNANIDAKVRRAAKRGELQSDLETDRGMEFSYKQRSAALRAYNRLTDLADVNEDINMTVRFQEYPQ